MKTMDFIATKEKIMQRLSEQKSIVLATCENGKVAARTVYCTSNGMKIYFMTSKAYRKYKQICKNPNVGLCFGNVQIQGTAKILGHPLSVENKLVLESCSHLEDEFLHWTKYKNTVLIEVDITEVECWNRNGREFLDLIKETSYRIG